MGMNNKEVLTKALTRLPDISPLAEHASDGVLNRISQTGEIPPKSGPGSRSLLRAMRRLILSQQGEGEISPSGSSTEAREGRRRWNLASSDKR